LIAKLLQFDGTWKTMLSVAAIGVVFSLLVPLKNSSPDSSSHNYVMTIALMYFFMMTRTRATVFRISLPVPARQLFLAHAISSLSPLWAPSITASIIAHFCRSGGHFLIVQLLTSCSVTTLSFFIMNAADLKEQEAPWDMRIVSFGVLFIVSVCLEIVLSFFSDTSVLLAIFLIPSAFLFIYIWIKLPKSFLISQPGTTGLLDSYAEALDSTARGSLLTTWKPILKSFTLRPFLCLFLILLLFFSALAWHFGIFIIIAIGYVVVWAFITSQISWLYTLPISRSILLPLLVAPLFLLIIAGYTIGISIKQLWFPRPPISISAEFGPANKALWHEWLPREFWRSAPAVGAPMIQAPWGETYTPPTVHALGQPIYNPYAVGDDNSTRFFEWQLGRATQAAYGRAISISEFKRPGGIHPHLAYPARFKLIHMGLLIAFSLFVISYVDIANWRRLRRIGERLASFLVMLGIGSLALFFWPAFRVLANEFVNSLPIRISGFLPDNLFGVVAIIVTSLTGLYWMVDRLHREAEF
jgi:hypothetical protein